METKTRLENALKDAIRNGEEVGKRTIRMAMAAIKQTEIDRQQTLDESTVCALLQKELRTRRESLEEAQKAGRADLVAELEAEMKIVQRFLPQALSPDELNTLVKEAIAETSAVSPADMGKVMKILMPRVQGRLPGDQVSQAVRELLQK